MLSRIHIEGLGPHPVLDIALNAKGPTFIIGPSESGKSTLIDAVTATLWGCTRTGAALSGDMVADDHTRFVVEATTPKGTLFRRTMTAKRSQQRQRQDPGQMRMDWHSEEKWARALGPLGNKALLLPVLAPFVWRQLLDRERGRPLRDWLATFLVDRSKTPAVVRDLVAEDLRGQLADSAFGLGERDAVESRKAANKTRDHRQGALQQAETALRQLGAQAQAVEAPSQEAVEAAKGILEAAKAWETHERDRGRHERAMGRHLQAVKRWEEHQVAVKALGEKPSTPQAQLKGIQRSVKAAQGRHAEAAQANVAAKAALADAERAVPRPPEAPEVEHWVFDENEGWSSLHTWSRPDDEEDIADAPDRVFTAGDGSLLGFVPSDGEGYAPWEVIDHLRALASFDPAAEKTALAKVDQLRVEQEQASHGEQVAKRMLDEELAAQEKAAAEHDAFNDYQAKRARLGSVPKPGNAPEAPEAPESPRPAREDVAGARSVLEQNAQAQGAAKANEAQRARLQEQVTQAREAANQATLKARAWDALVEAVRAAPGKQLEAGAAQLNSILRDDGVQLLIGQDDKAAMSVQVDGRDFDRASTGRQIRADLSFRIALRKVLGMEWLPIFVDNASSWSGPFPTSEVGPVIYLVTRAQEELTSSADQSGKAA